MTQPQSDRETEIVLHPVERARAVARSLLRLERPGPEAIERCLGDVHRHVLRHVLVDEPLGGFLAGDLVDRIEAAFRHLGLDRQRDRLLAIVADRDRGVRLRAAALRILAAAGGGFDAALGDEQPWVKGAIVDLSLRAALLDLLSHPAQPGSTLEALVSLPPPMRKKAFADMEAYRRTAGIPAALVYGQMLGARVWAEQREAMLTAIVDEGDEAALDLLARLRDAEPEPRARRALSRAVLELRTRRMDPVHAPLPLQGEATLTAPDLKGTATLSVRLDNLDGSITWILCNLSPVQGLLEAKVIAGESRIEAEHRAALLQITEIFGAIRVRLGQAARLARDAAAAAAARTPRAEAATIDAALFLLDRIPGEELPPIEPATSLPDEVIRDLVRQVRYVALTLPEVFEAVPDGVRPEFAVERWLRKTAGVIARPAVQARLSGILRYMSVWHALAGEPENAALAAGLAQATERDFRTSPLVHRLILEELDGRSFERRPLRPGDFVEDPAKRRRLRDRFFADLGEPRLQDVARLDLTEVAYWALELAFERAALDVGDELRERTAYLLASRFLAFGEGPARLLVRRKRRQALVLEMSRVVASELGLDPERAHGVAALVETDLAVFEAQVCSQCPFLCAVNAEEVAGDLLDVDGHPAEVDEA